MIVDKVKSEQDVSEALSCYTQYSRNRSKPRKELRDDGPLLVIHFHDLSPPLVTDGAVYRWEWSPDGLTTKHKVSDVLAAQMKKATRMRSPILW